jgi:hypothetical protein
LARVRGAEYRFADTDKVFDDPLSCEEYLAAFSLPRTPAVMATFTEVQPANLVRPDERRRTEMSGRFASGHQPRPLSQPPRDGSWLTADDASASCPGEADNNR